MRDLWRAHPEKTAEDSSVAVLDYLTKAAVKLIPAVDIDGYATLDMPMENVEAWARVEGVQKRERRAAQRLKARRLKQAAVQAPATTIKPIPTEVPVVKIKKPKLKTGAKTATPSAKATVIVPAVPTKVAEPIVRDRADRARARNTGKPQPQRKKDKAHLTIRTMVNSMPPETAVNIQQANSKKKGSDTRERYDKYRLAKTLGELKKLNPGKNHLDDICWDFQRKFITIGRITQTDKLGGFKLNLGASVFMAAIAADGDLSHMVALDLLSNVPRLDNRTISSVGLMQNLYQTQKAAEMKAWRDEVEREKCMGEVDALIAETTRLTRLEADVVGSERTPEPHGMSNAGAEATIAECMGWRDPTVKIRDYKSYLLNDDKSHGANIKRIGMKAGTGD